MSKRRNSSILSGTGIYIRPDAVLAGQMKHGALALFRSPGGAEGYLGRGPRSLSAVSFVAAMLAAAAFFAVLYFLAPNGSAS